MQLYTIYKATNTFNGKIYVGFTKNWPGRVNAHKRQSKSSPMRFHCAIRKYGWDAFEWAVIYQSWDYDHCLNTMEPYFISEAKSQITGYNNNRLWNNKGKVTVVNRLGQTNYISVELYRSQLNGVDSEWCTTRSQEGKKRLAQVKHV